MKITKRQLRQLIQEEARVLNEGTFEENLVNTSQALESLLDEFIKRQSTEDREIKGKQEFHKHMKRLLTEPDAPWNN